MSHAPLLVLCFIAQAPAEHAANPVFRELLAEGLTFNGTTVVLPVPTLADGQAAEASLAVVKSVAGDDRAARELLRDSITAPFILKTRDVKAGDAIARVADLWFVVHARLEDVDPEKALGQAKDQAVEVGNMRFETRILSEADRLGRKIRPLPLLEGRQEWYTRQVGRLLGRIKVEATDRAVATRSADSLVIASKTDHAFDADARFANRWMTLTRTGSSETTGPERNFVGSISYVKITGLAAEPGALFVEAHLAYVEPTDWFQGNPILRSKIGVIAQDQIRRLRREIEKKRAPR